MRAPFEGLGGYLVKGQEGCVGLWPHERYHEWMARLEAQADDTGALPDRNRVRVFSSSELVIPDVQGRIPVASYLQDWGGIDPTRVLVRGANRIVELWNTERWEELEAMAEQELLGAMAGAS